MIGHKLPEGKRRREYPIVSVAGVTGYPDETEQKGKPRMASDPEGLLMEPLFKNRISVQLVRSWLWQFGNHFSWKRIKLWQ